MKSCNRIKQSCLATAGWADNHRDLAGWTFKCAVIDRHDSAVSLTVDLYCAFDANGAAQGLCIGSIQRREHHCPPNPSSRLRQLIRSMPTARIIALETYPTTPSVIIPMTIVG